MLKKFKPPKQDSSYLNIFKKLNTPTRFVFLQEAHSLADAQKKWSNEFQGQLFFQMKENSCGVERGYHRKNYFKLLNKDNEKV